ncbi:hypothetical protein P7951_46 [Streptococcus phage P7951]|uniref:Uncharacterized protein n=1 Tax=Streptococcus phage P7951 TaxID=1971436 RepID=A0A286QQN5_9CAUD|nr:hypothetical protein PQF01_gp46 [Streptococcus phage P7951]ARU14231.1 hypothetical protein P7951_46 [Streptococcus phage P7951]
MSKKLPSHDRLTTDKGVEPLTANKNKEFELRCYHLQT